MHVGCVRSLWLPLDDWNSKMCIYKHPYMHEAVLTLETVVFPFSLYILIFNIFMTPYVCNLEVAFQVKLEMMVKYSCLS